MITDGPAALRSIATVVGYYKYTMALKELAVAWEAERQACQSAVEEADRLRFAAEAQAAADRAALAQARALLAEWRDLQAEFDEFPTSDAHPMHKTVEYLSALGQGAR